MTNSNRVFFGEEDEFGDRIHDSGEIGGNDTNQDELVSTRSPVPF
jgi:hypothetical protein